MEMNEFNLPEKDPNAYSLDEILKNVADEARAQVQPERRVKRQPKPKKDTWQANVLMYMHDLVRLLGIIVLVSMLLFRVVVVSGPSMYNTLLDGDYLLVLSNLFYHEPEQGDVIIISKESFDNGKPIVKRVIATEGQIVNIDFHAGVVYVDGIPLDEPYTYTNTNLKEGISFPLTVEEGCIFVLGDNRNSSKDSRNPEIGQIDKREVLGKVFLLFLPGTHFGTEQRDFGRIGVVK